MVFDGEDPIISRYWDNISYYIFSEVIEASAQRKVPPFLLAEYVCKGVIVQSR